MEPELVAYTKGLGIGTAIGALWTLMGFYPIALAMIGSLLFLAMLTIEIQNIW